MYHDLSRRVALVSGASRGLGAAIALKLGRCGASVAINYLTSEGDATIVADQVRSSGGNAEIFRADVRKEEDVYSLARRVEEKLGPVDILVINAAGPQPVINIENLTWRDWFPISLASPGFSSLDYSRSVIMGLPFATAFSQERVEFELSVDLDKRSASH